MKFVQMWTQALNNVTNHRHCALCRFLVQLCKKPAWTCIKF